MKSAIVGAALGLALLLPQAAGATTLVTAAFGGTLTAGSSAVKAPFNAADTGIVQGMTVNGTFVFDSDLTPGAGTGFVLVPFADLATDPAQAFEFTIGSLNFDLSTETPAPIGVAPAILFNNGVFNGFNYISDFTFTDGLSYRLRFNSRNFTVTRVDPATGFRVGTTTFLQGNLGTTLTESSFVPQGPAVPEPASWALMILGLGGVGAVMRQRRVRLAAA